MSSSVARDAGPAVCAAAASPLSATPPPTGQAGALRFLGFSSSTATFADCVGEFMAAAWQPLSLSFYTGKHGT